MNRVVETLEKRVQELQNENQEIVAAKEAIKAEKEVKPVFDQDATKQINQLRDVLVESDAIIERQKKQIEEITTIASKKYAEQQNQMQGLESLLEQVKQKYEEFIQVSKIENDSQRQAQVLEYEQLKQAFEAHKKEQYDEKRSMMMEHQAMLYTLQSLFDEYKKTCEFLFHSEVSKLEEELVTQSMRYEHEILCVLFSCFSVSIDPVGAQ
jgi:myosin heavy subunit